MENHTAISTVLVTAYAKAPQGSAMYEMYKHAGIVLEIDINTHEIVDAEFTFIAELTKNFFRRLVVGYNLSHGIEELVERIESHYFAPSSNAVVVCLKGAYKRFYEKINKINV
ncbi:DUF3870 domain-containing protein [Robertmurraya massiliosenegalensis]|uniref:DUF3870 domain-containing protein n=1 Tax=Robertmurraya TaxID=2837507 RepID=UPI0039A68AFD